jgi:hypothetical protein
MRPSLPRGYRAVIAILAGLGLMGAVNMITQSAAGYFFGAIVGAIIWLATAPREQQPQQPAEVEPIWDAAGRRAARRPRRR